MSNQGSYSKALADDVFQHLHNRETLIERLDKLHRESVLSRSNRVQRLLYGLHNASLATVEAITAWNLSKQDDWSRQKNRDFNCNHLGISFNCVRSESKESPGNAIDASITAQSCPTNLFLWNGENYLQKMISDLDFVRDIPEALTFLGSGCPFHRNPFLLPLDIDELASLTRSDGTKQDALLTKMSNNPWKDVNVHRVRRAAFHILLDEYHRQHRHFLNDMQSRSSDRETHMIYPSCLSREAMNSAFFYPPELSLDNLIEYLSMVDPPVSAVVAVSCARLLLNSVGEDITNKLVFLTKPIVLKIFRLPINELTEKATAYNPLHQVDQKIVRIIYPFVMHREMNPDLMTDVSDKIIYLSIWLRALVSRVAVSDYASNISVDVDTLFLELKVDHQPKKSVQKGIRSPMTKLFVGNANKENEDGHENRLVNQSIQTEESMISEDNDSLNKCKFLEAKLGAEPECKQLVPFPVAVTVNVIEGSQIVTVNGSMEAVSIFKQGDIVRIYDAYKSLDWEISSAPKDEDGISFEISDVYDHSRIRAEQEKSRDDTLNRLCYPYKKKMLNISNHSSVDNPCVIEDSHRHVASDMQHSINSPLHMRNIKIWKLIPEEDDMRPTWRKEYDNGMVPWEWDNAECNMYIKHFRIRVSKEVIEQQCKDSPFSSELCVHQQRVNFFENVPLSEVIEQAFHAVCRWHPKGSLIDNVKWAKLSRKMRFLSNLKNSKHEIDMAFVRHSLERKLDLSRFISILEDISLIEHPALSREVSFLVLL